MAQDELRSGGAEKWRSVSPCLEDDVVYLLLKFEVEAFAGCPATPVPADFADDGAGRSRHVARYGLT